MTLPPRTIRQPGPAAAERAVVVAAGALPIDVMLQPGLRLLDALAALMTSPVESACLRLSGGGLGPFAYVIPSLPPDETHAAYYSATFCPAGETRLDIGAVTLGLRDGRPFFHCHALWIEADGHHGCGHILTDDTVIAAPIRAQGAGIVGARFEVHPDPETGFSLFAPYATGTSLPPQARPAAALRLRPNQDLTTALSQVGRTAGFRRAIVQGGVASIIGARFTDAPQLEGFATEMLVQGGVVADITELDVAIVDFHGTIRTGRLVAGDNPVLMTFEGLLEAA